MTKRIIRLKEKEKENELLREGKVCKTIVDSVVCIISAQVVHMCIILNLLFLWVCVFTEIFT